MSKDEPAFPFEGRKIEMPDGAIFTQGTWPGLTKREYAAIQIMAASAGGGRSSPEQNASWSIKCADALLAELEKTDG